MGEFADYAASESIDPYWGRDGGYYVPPDNKPKPMAAKVTIDKAKKTATIVLDLLPEPRVSGTGNTINLAEARNEFTGLKHDDGREIKVTAQVYIKPPKT